MKQTCDLLVVDDDPVIRQLLCDVFDDPTYRILEAESADTARGIVERETPDLVLLDIGLPGEDGLSLARYIREHHDIPIIIVSGADQSPFAAGRPLLHNIPESRTGFRRRRLWRRSTIIRGRETAYMDPSRFARLRFSIGIRLRAYIRLLIRGISMAPATM